ncbi:MAG: phosphoribosylanthranilate isomerase [Clostridia bacterium]|nr:phosphoribosylanthranilate isomerase [Clostridia bacterium]
MTKIKICGLTTPLEAEWVSKSQVDYAGMVLFFPKSKRNITIEQAKEIMKSMLPQIQKVAVVVSPSALQIKEIQKAGFDIVQIHGQVLPEALETLRIPFLRAFNVDNMQEWERYEAEPKCIGYVFDAVKPGSGETFDWSSIPNLPEDGKPYLLAGGLNPDNVGSAVAAMHPYGVDVSSGVERDSGTGKDPDKMGAFVRAVRGA